MRVLISAFVCEPGIGSEPGAAWTWAAAAAKRHDVWLVTDPRNRSAIETQLGRQPDLHMEPVYLELPAWTGGPWASTPGLRNRYIVWQHRLRREVRRIQAHRRFDVAHHLTIGADWLPAGIAAVEDVPLVWGPVGGAAPFLPGLWAKVGAKALVTEMVRVSITGTGRRLVTSPVARRADLMVAQNQFVAAHFAGISRDIVVEPNVALSTEDLRIDVRAPVEESSPRATRHALFVGRLLAFKGLRLAVAALARPEARNWTLDVMGTGADDRAGRDLVRKLGLDDRVRFLGHVARPDVLAALSRADALLFPSMHDAAGWAVGEALSLGCPVVCLDIAGPAELVTAETGVRVDPRGDVVGGLARGLQSLRGRIQPVRRWDADRLPDVLSGWYERAIANHGTSRLPVTSASAR